MDETRESTAALADVAAASTAQDAVHTVGVTKSKTHGRIRMSLDQDHRSPEEMARLKAQLEQDPHVGEVEINQRTGSVTVKHHPGHDGHDILHRALKEVELISEVALEIEPGEEEGEGEGGSGQARLDQQIADVMVRFDEALYRRTGGLIHARGRVLPLSIAGLGVAQILAYGITLEMLPGPVLLWIAFDIHRRFTREHPYSTTAAKDAEPDAAAQVATETPAEPKRAAAAA